MVQAGGWHPGGEMKESSLKGLVMGAFIYGLLVGMILEHAVAGLLAGLGVLLTGIADQIEIK
jgi:hypothetical protein